MKRNKVDESIIDFGPLDLSGLCIDPSDKGPPRNPEEGKDELREAGFSEGEINAHIEAGNRTEDYFLLLYKNCPEALQPVKGGFIFHEPDYCEDPLRRMPCFMHLRSTELLSMDEAAKDSGVKLRTIQRWLKEGLESFKIDRRVLIPYDDLDKFGRGRDHDVGEISHD